MRKTTECRFPYKNMQQYFAETALKVGEIYQFSDSQAHHAGNVVRLDHETIRLVYNGIGYFAEGYSEGKKFKALVQSQDPCINELKMKVTVCPALIRRDKFELVLQKLTELGVDRIVPFVSSRCIVKTGEEKKEKQLLRWNSILQEASEQCKRNRIPEITAPVKMSQLNQYSGDCSFAAYEKAGSTSRMLSQALYGESCTIVIGPEGGFSEAEVQQLVDMGYESISLGTRILRAETAAVYAMSVAAEWSAK